MKRTGTRALDAQKHQKPGHGNNLPCVTFDDILAEIFVRIKGSQTATAHDFARRSRAMAPAGSAWKEIIEAMDRAYASGRCRNWLKVKNPAFERRDDRALRPRRSTIRLARFGSCSPLATIPHPSALPIRLHENNRRSRRSRISPHRRRKALKTHKMRMLPHEPEVFQPDPARFVASEGSTIPKPNAPRLPHAYDLRVPMLSIRGLRPARALQRRPVDRKSTATSSCPTCGMFSRIVPRRTRSAYMTPGARAVTARTADFETLSHAAPPIG